MPNTLVQDLRGKAESLAAEAKERKRKAASTYVELLHKDNTTRADVDRLGPALDELHLMPSDFLTAMQLVAEVKRLRSTIPTPEALAAKAAEAEKTIAAVKEAQEALRLAKKARDEALAGHHHMHSVATSNAAAANEIEHRNQHLLRPGDPPSPQFKNLKPIGLSQQAAPTNEPTFSPLPPGFFQAGTDGVGAGETVL